MIKGRGNARRNPGPLEMVAKGRDPAKLEPRPVWTGAGGARTIKAARTSLTKEKFNPRGPAAHCNKRATPWEVGAALTSCGEAIVRDP
jgi:hypothetical protein